MAETTSYRKRVAKPRGQAVQSPVTKQQPDDGKHLGISQKFY